MKVSCFIDWIHSKIPNLQESFTPRPAHRTPDEVIHTDTDVEVYNVYRPTTVPFLGTTLNQRPQLQTTTNKIDFDRQQTTSKSLHAQTQSTTRSPKPEYQVPGGSNGDNAFPTFKESSPKPPGFPHKPDVSSHEDSKHGRETPLITTTPKLSHRTSKKPVVIPPYPDMSNFSSSKSTPGEKLTTTTRRTTTFDAPIIDYDSDNIIGPAKPMPDRTQHTSSFASSNSNSISFTNDDANDVAFGIRYFDDGPTKSSRKAGANIEY